MMEITGNGHWPEIRTRLKKMRGELGDFKRLHALFGKTVEEWVGRNFAVEGRLIDDQPSGWPPLSPATLAARTRKGAGTMILQESGRLRRNTRSRSDSRGAVVTNPVPYASVHQLGLGVPRRPFFPSPGQTRRIVHPVLTRFVEDTLQ